MTNGKKNKHIGDKYNFPYVYSLLHEIENCIHRGYSTKRIHCYALSKLVPKLEKLLDEICDDSKRY